MRIPRGTTYILAIALTDTNATKTGDVVRIKKDTFNDWIEEVERTGKTFTVFLSNIRNDNFYKILETA